MDSDQATSQLSNAPSGSSSIETYPPFDSDFSNCVKTNALNNDTKPSENSSSISSFGISDDGFFPSGEEEFETAPERPVKAYLDEEALDSSEILKANTAMPVAVATADDDVEKDPILNGEEEGEGGIVVGKESRMDLSAVIGDGVADSMVESESIGAEGLVGKPEVVGEPISGENSILNPLVGEGGLVVPEDSKVLASSNGYKEVENLKSDEAVSTAVEGCFVPEEVEVEETKLNGDKADGDKEVEILKSDEAVSTAVEGGLVPEEVEVEETKLNGEKADEDKKSGDLNAENSVIEVEADKESEQIHDDNLEPENSKLVDAYGVKFTTEGDSVVEAIHLDVSKTGLAVVGDMDLMEDKKSGDLNAENSVIEVEADKESEQIHDDNLEPENSKLVDAHGVKFTTEGDSVVEAIHLNVSKTGSAVVGDMDLMDGLVNGSARAIHVVERPDDSDFENCVEPSNPNSNDVAEPVDAGLRESKQEPDSEVKQHENTATVASDGVELGSIREAGGADGYGDQAKDIVAESALSNLSHDAKYPDNDASPTDDGSEEGLPGDAKQISIHNSRGMLEEDDEEENLIDGAEDIDGSVSDGDTDGMIFGSSAAARQFIEELERGSAAGSHSGAESSHGQPQRIDGQIVTDSDEEVDTDEEGGGKELFDSAALAALLKAATGDGSDGGNITITSQDGSRLFSIERPAGLGSSARSFKPVIRPNRANLFTPPVLTTGGESENKLSEEEKKKLEKLQLLRVKFLRLVQRLGASPDESVAAQVLYRLALIAGRQTSQTFSLDAAKRAAMDLEAERKDDLDFSVNILVLGKSGVGKSATINSIFGDEKALIDAFEPATTTVKEISGVVNGVMIKVFDTPGLKSSFMEQAFNRRVLSSVSKFTKKSPPDIVLYVDRLDSQTRDLNDLPLLKTITSSLGPSIWRSAIVTLTHGASAPPDGPSGSPLSYEVFVTQRSHIVQQSIGHAVGDLRMMSPSLMNPVTLVENHQMCRKNREGQKVLPNGQTWRPQLLLLCYSMKILSEANSLSKPQDALDHRKLFGFRARSPPLPYMLSSMLQTRAHPKLSTDQGIDTGDSDIDLADLSDVELGEEEDEYDQLPPFKPLKKSQIAKLSKEQRNAYFEEYDYRLKLLQKKQWREELKRMREMKNKGKDATNENGFMGEDDEQENGGAAPVSTPLPDMALPPSFDSDSPAYRYRFLEPTSQFLARPVLDTHGWDHDCGYDGVNLEQSLAIASRFPAAVTLQITKDKKDFSIHLDSSVAVKHGEDGSSMAGFDIQTIGKQLAYIVRGETKFKKLKKHKTAAGISVTFLGENVATGLKIEDQIAWGKQWALVGSAGTVRCQSDAAYGANFELQRKELDYPVGQVQSTYGLSLIKWRGDWALGFNTLAQFSLGRTSKVAVRAGINNKLSGQITVRTSSSEDLTVALAAIIPIVATIFKKLSPAVGDNYSIY